MPPRYCGASGHPGCPQFEHRELDCEQWVDGACGIVEMEMKMEGNDGWETKAEGSEKVTLREMNCPDHP
jgi:hypothetical protein